MQDLHRNAKGKESNHAKTTLRTAVSCSLIWGSAMKRPRVGEQKTFGAQSGPPWKNGGKKSGGPGHNKNRKWGGGCTGCDVLGESFDKSGEFCP